MNQMFLVLSNENLSSEVLAIIINNIGYKAVAFSDIDAAKKFFTEKQEEITGVISSAQYDKPTQEDFELFNIEVAQRTKRAVISAVSKTKKGKLEFVRWVLGRDNKKPIAIISGGNFRCDGPNADLSYLPFYEIPLTLDDVKKLCELLIKGPKYPRVISSRFGASEENVDPFLSLEIPPRLNHISGMACG
jgi:hypothetical protein